MHGGQCFTAVSIGREGAVCGQPSCGMQPEQVQFHGLVDPFFGLVVRGAAGGRMNGMSGISPRARK